MLRCRELVRDEEMRLKSLSFSLFHFSLPHVVSLSLSFFLSLPLFLPLPCLVMVCDDINQGRR